MKATRVREALDHRDYDVREDSDCCCYICWEIKEGELLCNIISSNGCYSSCVLVIDGEDVAEFVRYAGLQLYEIDDYPEDYEGEDDNDSLRDDVRDLIQLGEMVPRGFPPNGPAHARAVRDSLRDYIESLVADGWRLYRDNERGFANEYDCVLVSPDAPPGAIDDDWDTLAVESWCAGYLYAGDPVTEAYNGIRIVE